MKKFALASSFIAMLAACGDAPAEDTGTDPGTDPGITPSGVDVQLAGSLQAVSYDPATQTLQVDMYALDANAEGLATYDRDALLDIGGYTAFTTQDDALDRYYTAFAAESTDGSVQGVLVMDGGQFGIFFGGTSYEQIGAYSAPAPDTGLVSYSGNYIGLLNFGTDPSGGAVDPSIAPSQSYQIAGVVFINADFEDNAVNGAIYDRVNVEGVLLDVTDTIYLTETTIEADGSFVGGATAVDLTNLGVYGGTFGGDGASSVAGSINLTEDFIPAADGEEEFGIFVLDQCTVVGPTCL